MKKMHANVTLKDTDDRLLDGSAFSMSLTDILCRTSYCTPNKYLLLTQQNSHITSKTL